MPKPTVRKLLPSYVSIVLRESFGCRFCSQRLESWEERADHEEQRHPHEISRLRRRAINGRLTEQASTERLASLAGLLLVPIDAEVCPHCGADVHDAMQTLRRQL